LLQFIAQLVELAIYNWSKTVCISVWLFLDLVPAASTAALVSVLCYYVHKSHTSQFISICDQPPRSTQPGHPFMGRCIEYQPKGSDIFRL